MLSIIWIVFGNKLRFALGMRQNNAAMSERVINLHLGDDLIASVQPIERFHKQTYHFDSPLQPDGTEVNGYDASTTVETDATITRSDAEQKTSSSESQKDHKKMQAERAQLLRKNKTLTQQNQKITTRLEHLEQYSSILAKLTVRICTDFSADRPITRRLAWARVHVAMLERSLPMLKNKMFEEWYSELPEALRNENGKPSAETTAEAMRLEERAQTMLNEYESQKSS